jgi:hypothetical protein
MNKRLYDILKGGIERGIYTCICLIRTTGGVREIVIPNNRIGEGRTVERLNYIKYQCEKNLPTGTYQIECKTGIRKSSLTEKFDFEIKPHATITVTTEKKPDGTVQEQIVDKTLDQETMNQIDLDEYIKLVKECEHLRAQNAVLMTQMEMMKANPAQGLSDAQAPANGVLGAVMKTLDDNLPTALSILDKFMEQRDKANDLKERELDLAESGVVTKKIKKVAPVLDRNKILYKMQQLQQSDPGAFEATLNDFELKDPATYEYLCDQMNLWDEDEGEDQEQN